MSDGKVRGKECLIEGCYNLRKHINGSRYSDTCIFHQAKEEAIICGDCLYPLATCNCKEVRG